MANKKTKPELSNCYIIDVSPTIKLLFKTIEESIEEEDYEHAAMCRDLLELYCSEGITYNQISDKQVKILKKYNKYEPS